MSRHKATHGDDHLHGDGARGKRSGQGAGSALDEMLRRQAQNPRPDGVQAPGPAHERAAGQPAPNHRNDD